MTIKNIIKQKIKIKRIKSKNIFKKKIALVWFYRISTIVGYLMPNPVQTYISNICKHI